MKRIRSIYSLFPPNSPRPLAKRPEIPFIEKRADSKYKAGS